MDRSISEAPSSLVQSWFKFLPPTQVVKRDGRIVAFDARRIASALSRAGRASGEFKVLDESEEESDGSVAGLLAQRVVTVLRHRFCGRTPSVDQIQDVSEEILLDAEYLLTLRAYVAHRASRAHRSQGGAQHAQHAPLAAAAAGKA